MKNLYLIKLLNEHFNNSMSDGATEAFPNIYGRYASSFIIPHSYIFSSRKGAVELGRWAKGRKGSHVKEEAKSGRTISREVKR